MTTGMIGKLDDLFSDYRAEWSAELFENLFIAPPYFEKLETAQPCLLIGGRGTGKTTSLRSLRFDASAARYRSDDVPEDALNYLGIYIRINKNRVRAFQGSGLSQDNWNKAFAHYFNLLCAIELCRLVEWLDAGSGRAPIDISRAAASLNFGEVRHAPDLARQLESALVELELFVNNPLRLEAPVLSMPETPLTLFASAIMDSRATSRKLIFCCIDEYENLLDDQQAVLNTYIKHSQPPLTYKVGIKRNGLRSRATIDSHDVLCTPDDYSEIDIGQQGFDLFVQQVVEHRLRIARERGATVPERLDEFLEELPFSFEAEMLGCRRIAEAVEVELARGGDAELLSWAKQIPANELYFLRYWSESEAQPIMDLARDWKANPETWRNRLGNYGYASLFWLSKGRKGARIRKYYAGARTLTGLASGNIRYFIELIDESLNDLKAEPEQLCKWKGTIPPESQTAAARAVGKRRLDQLEGLSESGAEIKRLVLALGKVFFEFAREPIGKTPERTSFVLSGSQSAQDAILRLLHEGVASLAFEATPRTKATTQLEMRDDEFRLHPIFAAFFEYSHRRKRRCTFSAETLLEVLRSPTQAIATLIGHPSTPQEELPRQLALFSSFYDAGADRK